MSIVTRIKQKEVYKQDNGVSLKEAYKLVANFNLLNELLSEFKIDPTKNSTLNIKGAQTLVQALLKYESKITKTDETVAIKDIYLGKLNEENQIEVTINKTDSTSNKKVAISALSAYSVRKDILDEIYFSSDRHLRHLKKINQDGLIARSISRLENLNSTNDKLVNLRYLKTADSKLHLRAITSNTHYKDYNLKFSVFITLYQLNILNAKGYDFVVEEFRFDDSDISVIFKENSRKQQVNKDVTLSFTFELQNNEVKIQALKLCGNFILETKNAHVNCSDVIKTPVLSISHNRVIKTTKSLVSNLAINIDHYISENIEVYKKINEVKNFDQLADFILSSFQKSKNQEVKKYYSKSEFKNTLTTRITSLFELLDKLHKLEEIIKDEDIQALDFLRDKIYIALVKKGRSTPNKPK